MGAGALRDDVGHAGVGRLVMTPVAEPDSSPNAASATAPVAATRAAMGEDSATAPTPDPGGPAPDSSRARSGRLRARGRARRGWRAAPWFQTSRRIPSSASLTSCTRWNGSTHSTAGDLAAAFARLAALPAWLTTAARPTDDEPPQRPAPACPHTALRTRHDASARPDSHRPPHAAYQHIATNAATRLKRSLPRLTARSGVATLPSRPPDADEAPKGREHGAPDRSAGVARGWLPLRHLGLTTTGSPTPSVARGRLFGIEGYGLS